MTVPSKRATIATELHQFLTTNGPFVGTIKGIANQTSRTPGEVMDALWWLRQETQVLAHGWTIPFQAAGRGRHEWRVVDTGAGYATTDEERALDTSRKARGGDVRSRLDGLITQTNFHMLAIQPSKANAPVIRQIQNVSAVLVGARAMVDQATT
jgi:hypothetical protein